MTCPHYIFGSVLQALYLQLWALTRINSKCQTLIILNVTDSNVDMYERPSVGHGDCEIESKHYPPRRGDLEALELPVASCWLVQWWEEHTSLSFDGRLF